MMFKYILLLNIVLVTACSEKKNKEIKEVKPEIIFEGSLIQPLYLGQLLESPNSFGPILDLETCRKNKFEKISIYVKGGHLPNRMSEKITYTFNSKGEPKDFSHYLYNFSVDPYSSSSFVYGENGKISKIDVHRFLNFSNFPPVLVENDSLKTIAVTSRGDGKSDSLIFYPSIENPRIILQVVNDFINSMEIIVPRGTATEDLKNIAMEVDSSLVDFELAEKTITFTENGLPVESYHIDNSWNKQEKSRTWDYNGKNQPVKYKEWLHGTLIKDIAIEYSKNNLPSQIIVNRKKYIFYSSLK